MKFLIGLGLFFIVLYTIVFLHYYSYDYDTKQRNIKEASSKIYFQPSFIFKSKEYKEFVYAK